MGKKPAGNGPKKEPAAVKTNIYIDWILKALEEQKSSINRIGLADALSISPPQITKMLSGDRSIHADELRLISNYIGRPIPGIDGGKIQPCVYVGDVSAGVWREIDNMDQTDETHFVPMIPRPAFDGMNQFAMRVKGPSFNRHIQDGEYVVAVPYFNARRNLTAGDIVIVERRRAGTVERTIKRIKKNAKKGLNVWELWPESDDERYQKPITMTDGKKNEDIEVEVTGLVIGKYQSFG